LSQFEQHYQTLAAVIRSFGLQGIDLDVEEHTMLDAMRRIIKRLRSDFGPNFIITLAPVYYAMLPHHKVFTGITNHLLNPN
jgi:chitinase